jgi:hypothetical protein
MYRDAERWDAASVEQSLIDNAVSCGEKAIVWGGNYYRMPPSRCWLAWEKHEKMDTLADFELAWTSLDRPSKRYVARRNADGKRIHPTQKPVGLMHWCIKIADDVTTILDAFMGSGTTLRAAKDLGRRAIGIEIEERYCEIAARRLAQEVFAWDSEA